jgi:hypothetical protein
MDVMWSMDSMPAVNAFIKRLPTRDGQVCASLVTIAVQDTLEQDNMMELYEQDAVDVIARVSSR